MEAAGTKSGAVQAAAASVESAASTVVAQPSEKKQTEPKPKQPRQRAEETKWKVFSGTANDG